MLVATACTLIGSVCWNEHHAPLLPSLCCSKQRQIAFLVWLAPLHGPRNVNLFPLVWCISCFFPSRSHTCSACLWAKNNIDTKWQCRTTNDKIFFKGYAMACKKENFCCCSCEVRKDFRHLSLKRCFFQMVSTFFFHRLKHLCKIKAVHDGLCQATTYKQQ